jgi:hypothetical protein
MGKDQRILQVITAYRPIKSTTVSLYTVHRQHWSHLQSEGRDVKSCDAILTNLTHHITAWRQDGENIVLMMDAWKCRAAFFISKVDFQWQERLRSLENE